MIKLTQAVLLLAIIVPAALMGGEFYQDLRGQQLPPSLHLYGRDAAKAARSESRGLRIYMPASRGKKAGLVGLSPVFSLSGDFEVTAAYEIIKAETPTTGQGAGVNLRLVVGSPMREATGLARYVRKNGKEVYLVTRNSKEEGAEPNNKMKAFPTKSKTGKLQLKRTGSTVHYLVADGSSTAFSLLHQEEFVSDKCVLRLAATRGESETDLDVRLVDLRIIAEELPTGRSSEKESGGWIIPLLISLVVIGLLGGGILWWRRRERD
jgi:hypothetical protein